jgi:hypothetical protein
MKSFRGLVIVVMVAGLATSGCAGRINAVMESWRGGHVSDLIASWGPPTQVMPDGYGGQILAYSDTRAFVMPGYGTTTVTGSAYRSGSNVYGQATGYTTYMPPVTTSYRAYRMFWVNEQGRVYRWSWRGL